MNIYGLLYFFLFTRLSFDGWNDGGNFQGLNFLILISKLLVFHNFCGVILILGHMLSSVEELERENIDSVE